MTQIKITAAPQPLTVNPQPAPIRIRVVSGPQGAPGVPEIYIQQTQPTAKAANAIWYQTGLLGNIDSEWVWDGAAWLEVSSASSGVARVFGVAPITVTGTSNAIVSVEDATQNTTGVLTLQMAADAAPVQNIIGGTNVDVSESGGNYTINAPANVSVFVNDAGYTNATQAAAAAPIQELVAGTDISIVENPGKSFTINALIAPQHQANWDETNTTVPSYIRNKPENVSDFNNDSGYINLAQSVAAAPVQSVNTKTGHVTLTAGDVGALPGNTYIPTKTSDLTNDGEATGGPFIDTAGLATELADYLPLAGGTVTGSLTVNQALLVPPAGSARGPTPPVNDASTRLATTEWVQDILAATGANRYTWFYNANYTGNNPGVGNLEIATDKSRIGISATDSGGNVRNLSALMPGDTIALTDDPATGPTTEFARYDVAGNITDHGGWYQIPVTLMGESNPPPAVGQDLRASFYLNSLASAVDGVSAGYGLTGGGMSGIVTLAIDTNVVAELSDVPTKVSELSNDSGYINVSQSVAAAPVQSVNAKTGVVVLTAADVGAAVPGDIPTHTGNLTNDGNGIGGGPFVDYAGLSTELGDYLPLAGGTMTGAISWGSGPVITDYNAGVFAIQTGGVERVRVSATGVQIPDNYKTHTGGVYGFFSQINESATNAETRQVLASGNAKSQFNGQILVTALSDSQPALANRSDPTSGISITDVTQFITQGVETARFDSLGHLCVGTKSTPLGTQPGIQLFGDQQPEIRFNNTATGEGPTTGTGLFLSNKNFGIRNRDNGGQVYVYTNNTVTLAVSQTSVLANVPFVSVTGTAAAPAYTFTGDADTGTFSPAVNVWAVATSGVSRLTIGATGQITAAAGYTPTAGQDLATKAYVDAAPFQTTNIPDGTPAAPAIAFANDKSTGIFRETATNCWCVSVGGLKRFEIDTAGDCYTSGWMGVATPDDATAALDVNGESIRIRQSVTPANANATGSAGEIMWDSNYLYVCVATNTWKRVALSSW